MDKANSSPPVDVSRTLTAGPPAAPRSTPPASVSALLLALPPRTASRAVASPTPTLLPRRLRPRPRSPSRVSKLLIDV